MSNATHSSRLLFQNSGANLPTVVGALPNGSSVTSAFVAYGGSTATDTATVSVVLNGGTDARINSGILGTGTYLPMTFYTGGSERMRLDTSGNLGIGKTAATGVILDANGVSRSTQIQMPNSAGTYTANVAGFHLFGFSDNNLYFNWFDAGAIVFRNNGATERMRIDSSGNVGIGTASPGTKLDVVVSTNNGLRISDGAVTGVVYASSGPAMVVGTTSNHPTVLYSNNAERMRIDSSGNVGIGGTAEAYSRLNLLGTYPTSSNATQVVRLSGTIPSGTTASYRSFLSRPVTQATAFTLTNLIHFEADPQTLGAGSAVTNQYGFSVADSLTGATNNYGFYSNIASGSNRYNFFANGTARNYFAGRTDVGNTRIEATNNWNGAQVTSTSTVTLTAGSSIDLTSAVAGGALISVYVTGSGNGGLFWANYSATVTKLVGNGEATDTGVDFAVYKNAASHTTTLKNKSAGTQTFAVAILAGALTS
jgi:hypothetical protein